MTAPAGPAGPPAAAGPGDFIVHRLVPGFIMQVQEVQPCETGPGRETPHSIYRVIDPCLNDYWVCAYDVDRYDGDGGEAA